MGTLAKPIDRTTGRKSYWKTKSLNLKMNWWGHLSFLFICTLLPVDGCWSQSSSGAQNRQGQAFGPNTSHEIKMGITIGGQNAGTVTIELFGKVVPRTAQNFYQLCDANAQPAPGTDGTLSGSFVGSPFHRIIPRFMIQGGDFTRGDGRGGESIYGEKFADENFRIKHTKKGLLSMANAGPGTNGSQFFITTVKTPWLDNRHVVFGEVLENYDLVKEIEGHGSRSGTPDAKITIADSGEIGKTEL